jgi:hypothetical protein
MLRALNDIFVVCQIFSKLRNNSNKKVICWLLDNYEQFLWENKIPYIFYIFSPFKPSLDFQKHFKTQISKIDPAVLEF